MRFSLIGALFFTVFAAAWGQSADTLQRVADNGEIAKEFTAIFSVICLDSFPDDAAVDKRISTTATTPLPAEQLNRELGGIAGRGWLLKSPHGEFIVLTTTEPARRSCTVRITTKGLFTPGPMYAALETMFALQNGLALQTATAATVRPADHYATTITNLTVRPDGSRGKHVFHLMKDYFTDRNDPKVLLTLDTALVHEIVTAPAAASNKLPE